MRMKIVVFILACIVFAFCILNIYGASPFPSEKSEYDRRILGWVKTEKIRATYTWAFYHKNACLVVKDLADTGFNSIFLKAESSSQNLNEWLSQSEKRNIRIFMCYNFWSLNEKNIKEEEKYRKIVYKDGRTGKAPCPLNYEYWKERILPGQLKVAKLSLKNRSIVGMIMDTEMYGIKPHAFLKDVCFCDDCFKRFLESRKLIHEGAVDRKRRYEWLKERKLLPEYYKLLEKRVRDCVVLYGNEIRKVNPSLILGNLNYVDSWFFNGLLEGFGVTSIPALIGPESPTYNDGYTPAVEKRKKKFRDRKYNVIYVPGIWDKSFFPDDLAENCYKLAMHTDGYFDFTIRALYGLIEPFNKELLRKSGGSLKNYWDALKFANNEIRWKTRLGDKYKSPLDVDNLNLALGKETLALTPVTSSLDMRSLVDGSKDFTNSVKFNVDGINDKVILTLDLGEEHLLAKARALCQGGGLKGGSYFPKSLKVYFVSGEKGDSGNITEMKWSFAGSADLPDVDLAFVENGQHSPGGYRRWITVPFYRKIKARYLKFIFNKVPDSYAEKATKINETKSKIIDIDEIEVYPSRW